MWWSGRRTGSIRFCRDARPWPSLRTGDVSTIAENGPCRHRDLRHGCLPAAAPDRPDATHSRVFAPTRIVKAASSTIRDCQSRRWLEQGRSATSARNRASQSREARPPGAPELGVPVIRMDESGQLPDPKRSVRSRLGPRSFVGHQGTGSSASPPGPSTRVAHIPARSVTRGPREERAARPGECIRGATLFRWMIVIDPGSRHDLSDPLRSGTGPGALLARTRYPPSP